MSTTRRVVITGRGVLSPLGSDWPSFAAAVRDGAAAPVAPFPGSLADDPVLCHPIFEAGVLTEGESGRASEPLSLLSIAAVRMALAEAGLHSDGTPLDDVGLVMSTVLGPSTAVEAYLETLMTKGPRASRPALFVDTLLSMPASRVGIALGLRGSTAVLGGSSAIELALDWVRHGREHTVVAGAGEYGSPKCARYYRALAERSGAERAALAQGAAFVVLESAGHADERGAEVFGELLGAGAASEPQEVVVPWSRDPEGRAFTAAMRDALADAGLSPEAVAAVALAAGDDAPEAGELAAVRVLFSAGSDAPALFRPKRRMGEALAASAPLGLLAALAELEAAGGGTALVNSFEMGGAVTSIVLRCSP